jgi:lactoylglutathione lyase
MQNNTDRQNMNDVELRVQRAAENLLENERLTAGLNDAAAQVLIDWGLDAVKAIAGETSGLSEEEAGKFMAPRLKATRRLMRYVNNWASEREGWDQVEEMDRLGKIYLQVQIVYGHEAKHEEAGDDGDRDQFLREIDGLSGDSAELIAGMRRAVAAYTNNRVEFIQGSHEAQPGANQDLSTSGQEYNLMGMKARIEHVALWTAQLETLKEFYCVFFGGQAGEKYVNDEKQFESYFLVFDGAPRLELMSAPNIAGRSSQPSTGWTHIAFSVSSKDAVDGLTEELRQNGHEVIGEPRWTGDGYYESVVLDPDGNQIEITI